MSVLLLSVCALFGAGDDWAGVRYRAGLAEVGKRYTQAEKLWEQALEKAGEDPFRRRVSLAGLGRTLALRKRQQEAVPHLKAAGRLYRSDGDAPAFERLRNVVRLADALRETGDLRNAGFAYREALTLVVEVEREDSVIEAGLHFGLARCQTHHGKRDEGIHSYRRALAIYDKRPGEDLEAQRKSLWILALLHQSPGKWAEALPYARRHLGLCEGDRKICPDELRKSRFLLARVLVECGHTKEAERLYRNQIRGPQAADAWVGIARVRFAQGRFGEAEMYVGKALEVQESHMDARYLLVDILKKLGRKKEAEALGKKLRAMWRQVG